MKNMIGFGLSFAMAGLMLSGCEKDEQKVYFEGATAPVLSASTANVVLTPATVNNEAISFAWTNPEYQFTTGVSSQDVSYALEIDTLGGNFNSKIKSVTSIAKDLVKSFTVDAINKMMGNDMLLTFGKKYTMEARVVATLRSSSVPQTSNKVSFTATPFAPPPKVELPTTGKLFLVGDASPGGWANPVPASQEFTKVSDTKYQLTVALSGGKSMLMLPLNGSWGDKYGFDGANNSNVAEGDNLKRGGGDIKVPPANGTYKIVADFQIGKFTITLQ